MYFSKTLSHDMCYPNFGNGVISTGLGVLIMFIKVNTTYERPLMMCQLSSLWYFFVQRENVLADSRKQKTFIRSSVFSSPWPNS